MYKQQHISRVFRADEYDAASSAPIPLARLAEETRFQPVQIGRAPWPSEDDLKQIRARAEQAGYEAGLALAETELAAQRKRDALAIRHLLDGLAQPFDDLNDAISAEISGLALQIAGLLAGRELSLNPELLVPIVADAVAALPSHARQVTIILHPDDVSLVQEQLQIELDRVAFVGDAKMKRGDCLVRSQAATVDASLAARLQRLIQTLPGFESAVEAGSIAGTETQSA